MPVRNGLGIQGNATADIQGEVAVRIESFQCAVGLLDLFELQISEKH
jgi:hypothetical protein